MNKYKNYWFKGNVISYASSFSQARLIIEIWYIMKYICKDFPTIIWICIKNSIKLKCIKIGRYFKKKKPLICRFLPSFFYNFIAYVFSIAVSPFDIINYFCVQFKISCNMVFFPYVIRSTSMLQSLTVGRSILNQLLKLLY